MAKFKDAAVGKRHSTLPSISLAFAFFFALVRIVNCEFPAGIPTATLPPEACNVRGGETGLLSSNGNYPAIDEFLADRNLKESMNQFHIHGWRWHTASLVRESGRLCTLAQRAQSAFGEKALCLTQAMQQAADYVVGFNMKGLHRVETDLMFPWMREKLTSTKSVSLEVSQEFGSVMDQLEIDRKKLVLIGDSIRKSAAIASNNEMGIEPRAEAIQDVVELSSTLQSCAQSMMDIENALLVPAISKLVPEADQHSFNNKVLRNLGIWDSRLHLVAMHEAVEASGNKDEKAIFEQTIPSIPQMMISRWKRKLYEPLAGVLDVQL